MTKLKKHGMVNLSNATGVNNKIAAHRLLSSSRHAYYTDIDFSTVSCLTQ